MKTRDWPIRSKLTALVVAPVTALLALWIFATTLTFGPALNLLSARTLLYDLGRPGETRGRRAATGTPALGGAARRQHRRCPRWPSSGGRTDRAVAELRRRVDGETAARRRRRPAGRPARPAGHRAGRRCPPGGSSSTDREVDRAGAIGLYSGMVDCGLPGVRRAWRPCPTRDLNRRGPGAHRARPLPGAARPEPTRCWPARSPPAGSPRASTPSSCRPSATSGSSPRARWPTCRRASRAAYQRLTEGEAFARLRAMQDDAGRAQPVRPAAGRRRRPGRPATTRCSSSCATSSWPQADALADRSVPMAVRILVPARPPPACSGWSPWWSRCWCRCGSAARWSAGSPACAPPRWSWPSTGCPTWSARLRRGEEVDVAREAPPLEYGDDEIGEVGRRVQRGAAHRRRSPPSTRPPCGAGSTRSSSTSPGAARRLLHRQLACWTGWSGAPRTRTSWTTCSGSTTWPPGMRRHAEDLVILAGAAPGRGWRNPVADGRRGPRRDLRGRGLRRGSTSRPCSRPASLVGRAVGDVIHLLAELIENATSFSPPHTRVQRQRAAGAERVRDRDRGPRPGHVRRRRWRSANQRLLASPPDFDPANSARLGLFVVARLAARHGIRVPLRPSADGGVTAVVLIPADLVTDRAAGRPATAADARYRVGRPEPAAGSDGRPTGGRRDPRPGPARRRRPVTASTAPPAPTHRRAPTCGHRRGRPTGRPASAAGGPPTSRTIEPGGLRPAGCDVRTPAPPSAGAATVTGHAVAPLARGGPPGDGGRSRPARRADAPPADGHPGVAGRGRRRPAVTRADPRR